VKDKWLRFLVWFAGCCVRWFGHLNWERMCVYWSTVQYRSSFGTAKLAGTGWRYRVRGQYTISVDRAGPTQFMFDVSQLAKLPDQLAVGEALCKAAWAGVLPHDLAQQIFTHENQRRREATAPKVNVVRGGMC